MTYILGWKLGPAVYIAADTALTVPGHRDQDQSSFGERVVDRPERSVFEGCLKIFDLGGAAVAISGDVPRARRVVETFSGILEMTSNPQHSIEVALNSHGPFDPQNPISLIVAFPNSPTPTLLSFNHDGNESLIEHEEGTLVQIGSITPTHKNISGQMIANLNIFKEEPDRFLVCSLALLQSYGIYDYLLERGVGGSFCGLVVRERSIEWARDILYVLHRGLDPEVDMVSSLVRDQVLVVRSSISNSCRYFADEVSCVSFDDWKARWWDSAFEVTSQGRFEFVVLLNTESRIVSVVEMSRNQSSDYLKLDLLPPEGPAEAFRFDIAFSPLLSSAMTEATADRGDGSIPFKLNWFPFSTMGP